jgi:hypothetical protein
MIMVAARPQYIQIAALLRVRKVPAAIEPTLVA